MCIYYYFYLYLYPVGVLSDVLQEEKLLYKKILLFSFYVYSFFHFLVIFVADPLRHDAQSERL